MRTHLLFLAMIGATLLPSIVNAETKRTPKKLLTQSKRIVFLGDSITASGQYVANFETWLLLQKLEHLPVVIDAGLASETVSGLSEEGHAGGNFPRPDLAERLERILTATKPDLIFACYGINCGIYQPFDAARLQKYQQGMENLRQQAAQIGATVVHITPPSFDDQRAKKPFSYNGVLDRYSEWLLAQREKGWHVVDLHHPMSQALAEKRKTEPEFTFQPDAVHPNEAGHWFITQQLCRWFGDDTVAELAAPQAMLKAQSVPAELLGLVQQRMSVLRDAYVSAAGHKRPGVAIGLPIPDAEKKAAELTAKIQALLALPK